MRLRHYINIVFIVSISTFLLNCSRGEVIKPESILNPRLDGKQVILVHGYGGSEASWRLVENNFPDGLEITSLSLIGFGLARPPDNFDFSLEQQAKALAAKLSILESDFVLVAHSMGAAIALIGILDYGIDPSHLILVDPLVFPQAMPNFISAQTIPIVSSISSWIIPPKLQVDFVLKQVFDDFTRVNPIIRQNYIDAFRKPFHRRALRQTAIALNSFDAAKFIERYAEIQVSTSIIWSVDDPLLDFANADLLQNMLTNSSVYPILDCGHAPHEECPEKFIDAIKLIFDLGSVSYE